MNLCRLVTIVCICLIESFCVGCLPHPEINHNYSHYNNKIKRSNNGTCLNEKCIKEGTYAFSLFIIFIIFRFRVSRRRIICMGNDLN